MEAILYSLYLWLFLFLISRFSFFKDDQVSIKLFRWSFVLKAAMGLLTYRFYFNTINNLPQGDIFSFFRDGEILNAVFHSSPSSYIKLLLGIYKEHTEIDLTNLEKTTMWFQHFTTGYINDNRYFIRVNSVFSFFSMHSIHIHSLFVNFISFLGLVAIYKSFKVHFVNKAKLSFFVLLLFPSVLFWGSCLLKESMVFFHLGFFIYFLKKFIETKRLYYLFFTLVFLIAGLLCKPYVLICFLLPFIIYLFSIKTEFKLNLNRSIAACLLAVFLAFTFNLLFNNKPVEAIAKKQYDFINLSQGGIFLLNDTSLIRLEQDNRKYLSEHQEKKQVFLKNGAKIMYWKLDNFEDTLYSTLTDSIGSLQKVWDIQKANSFFEPVRIKPNFFSLVNALPSSLLNACFRPFIWEIHNVSSLISAIESGVLFLLFLLFLFRFREKNIDYRFFFLALLFSAFLFSIIGLTVPVLGAIVRYRAPAYLFLSLLVLLVTDVDKIKSFIAKRK